MLDWWDSLDQFFKFGGGYGVICAGKAVALCYTSFVAGEKDWELGVNTHEDYRMQGYARDAALTLLASCRQRGIRPYWDCMEKNTPSRRLALCLGFSLAFTYNVYYFRV